MELDLSPTPAFPAQRAGVVTVPLRGARWRVTRSRGDLLGYVDRIDEGPTVRWRTARIRPRRDGLIPLGDYATADDALTVLGA